jgi:alkylation response protein AidB-like acyl-CoA dehydrogenase
MSGEDRRGFSEEKAMEVAEASRQADLGHPGFLKELFLGNFRFGRIHPFPREPERPEFVAFYGRLREFLRREVDPAAIDATGEYPARVLDGLRELGAFGMKIPAEYGGLGLTQPEYDQAMRLLGSTCGNLTALLSAHQSIGVPQPLKAFGTEEQKRKYLPRLARGAISAFALTEPDVGSDPARLTTTLEDRGDHYVLNGEKLWCTNATLAELIVVMGKSPSTDAISAVVVEMDSPGVEVGPRCRFMGLRALGNAVLRFSDVKVPKENLIGREGEGLKIALATLNTGRLALCSGVVGVSRRMLEICRGWCNERVQWGRPVGKHEAIARKLAGMAATTFAVESVTELASHLAERNRYDVRLEAAAAKEFCSEWGWAVVDDAMQIRGGRGYETESSLAARGEPPIGVERALRDSRINRIFEGSTEIMHLFIAREAVDRHFQVAHALVDAKVPVREKIRAIPRIALFYSVWYPTRFVGWAWWPKYREFGRLAAHLRFAERMSRRLSRAIFHGMVLHRAGLARKQAFLRRIVKAGIDLFAISAVVSRADRMLRDGQADHGEAVALADLFCRMARRRVRGALRELWRNDDGTTYRVAMDVLDGRYRWLEPEKASAGDTESPEETPEPA